MRKTLLLLSAALLVLGAAACSKQKSCRCSVLSSTRGTTVRIIKIESGDCEDIKSYSYHDEVDNLVIDTLLCTDYEFDIDN